MVVSALRARRAEFSSLKRGVERALRALGRWRVTMEEEGLVNGQLACWYNSEDGTYSIRRLLWEWIL